MVRAKVATVKKNGSHEEQRPDGAPKIMTKPLPQILDDLEGYITRVEDAVKQAKAAATESKEAAARAKAAGEEAAADAARKADAAITRALVMKLLSSKEFLLIVGAVIVGSVYAAVLISVGISGFW